MSKVVTFNVEPMGAPRMTQRDRWAQRQVVMRYFRFKDLVRAQAKKSGFELKPHLVISFYIMMPLSWSKKKRAIMNGELHDKKPDGDNLLKAFQDAFGEDKHVASVILNKFWTDSDPRIIAESW